ncbi:WD40 repeat domain-containing protein [Thermopolyspora flexuosa]|uniref:WD40 repeat domain-containing protein n=1 Tax=Thermopolyspora flexuosa TaxID=103836 RepID=UPI001FD2135B|nr:WD40 repeat domain-containing protein [Thermopolyspora flexuosa]
MTTADAEIRAQLPPDDDAEMATIGSVACAVHARGKMAIDVASEIARAVSASPPERVDDLTNLLRQTLPICPGQNFNVVIDALDEVSNPAEARAIIHEIALPLVETCADLRIQIVIGTRRYDAQGNLLDELPRGYEIIDLDDPRYFDITDLVSYALASLRLVGDERVDNPYRDDTVALPLAEHIAKLSDRNFFIAGLIARTHGLHDQQAATPHEITSSYATDTLRTYIHQLPQVGEMPAEVALAALSFAEEPGFTAELWSIAINTLYEIDISPQKLSHFARSSGANFITEVNSEHSIATFHIAHQVLNECLREVRGRIAMPVEDESRLTKAFISLGESVGWANAPLYLLRCLPAHAQRAGMIDALLTNDNYLCHADLRQLRPFMDLARSPEAQAKARLLSQESGITDAPPSLRATMLASPREESLVDVDLPISNQTRSALRYWTERDSLYGHEDGVNAVCAFTLDNQTLLATTSDDETIRIWDPRTGHQHHTLKGHTDWVNAVCAFTLDNQTLLATTSDDETIRIWDPRTGHQHHTLKGHTDWVNAVCAFTLDNQTLLATTSDDETIRIWDPRTGHQHHTLKGHTDWVNAVCAFTLDNQTLLATTSDDETIRIWDPRTGHQHHTLKGHTGSVNAVCAFTLDNQTLLATTSDDETIRIWDPRTGHQHHTLKGHTGSVNAVCAFTLDNQTLLATTSDDETIRIWDPRTGHQHHTLKGHTGSVNAVCAFTLDNQTLLATTSDDKSIRIWSTEAAV